MTTRRTPIWTMSASLYTLLMIVPRVRTVRCRRPAKFQEIQLKSMIAAKVVNGKKYRVILRTHTISC